MFTYLVHEPFFIYINKVYTATSVYVFTYVQVLFSQYAVIYYCDDLEAIQCVFAGLFGQFSTTYEYRYS